LSAPSTTTPTSVRVLWVLVSALLSLVLAIVAGILTAAGGSGSREESHLPAPTDPYVNLSVYTALVTLVTRQLAW
jgi:hypothetical protein